MFCTDELSLSIFNTLRYGFFSENAPALIYYSHLTAVIVSLALAAFVYSNSKKFIPSKILLFIALLFSVLAISDIFLWTQINGSILMFLWSFWIFLFSTIFMLSFYFLYTLLKGRDAPFAYKISAGALLVAILFFSLSHFNLESFDVINCTAVEGVHMINAIFGLSFLLLVATIVFGAREFKKAQDIVSKKQAVLATVGVSCFLLMFAGASYFASIANIFGAEPDTFKWEQYGYFGMTIFIGFLTYLIIEYKTFNVKLLAAQALVLALVGLIASQFFFIRNYTSIILVGITLFLALVFGFFLVRSVKREVKQREELAIANAGQENLIHIMNHQIKGYLTKARNIFAELKSEPDYGVVEAAKPMLEEGYKSLTEGVEFVQQVLQGSSAEKGTLTYVMKPLDFRALALETAEKQRSAASDKGLKFDIKAEEGILSMNADEIQLKEAVKNLIDNSIRYTPAGSITVNILKRDGKALLSVIDTGVGISEEDKPKLFQKGGRGRDSLKYNVNSTGYGLAFTRGVVEAHKGRVWAESAGPGKGSTFYMELPLV